MLPARILREVTIEVYLAVWQWEPIMFCTEYALENHLFAEVRNLCIPRVILTAGIPVSRMDTVKLLRCLDGIRCLSKEEPTLEVVETMSLEHKLYKVQPYF